MTNENDPGYENDPDPRVKESAADAVIEMNGIGTTFTNVNNEPGPMHGVFPALAITGTDYEGDEIVVAVQLDTPSSALMVVDAALSTLLDDTTLDEAMKTIKYIVKQVNDTPGAVTKYERVLAAGIENNPSAKKYLESMAVHSSSRSISDLLESIKSGQATVVSAGVVTPEVAAKLADNDELLSRLVQGEAVSLGGGSEEEMLAQIANLLGEDVAATVRFDLDADKE